MKLLGDWNWYLPTWLEWLPRVAPEEPLASEGDEDAVDDEARRRVLVGA